MQFKQLLKDDDAVSPVIGVILMVAITVILAAVIGTFVLGLGDQVQETAPNAQISFDYTEGTSDTLQITHDGGDPLPGAQTYVVISGSSADTDINSRHEWETDMSGDAEVTAGNSVTIDDTTPVSNGNIDLSSASVRIVWESESGDQSSTITTWEA
ncbi:type IV pilin N-terminal domain-containing protein [Natronomonas amylolytica]|uniref:type IV pilin N-terminal domain-containing protein n=1 Tax=Natronomonas amylolytica TaxID=3108498 RepID=UPI00300AEE04